MTEQSTVFAEIVAIIKEEMAKYHALELILFGSRATGTARPESDYDLMILVDNLMDNKERLNLYQTIYRKLRSEDKIIPLDIIIKTKQDYELESGFLGTLSFAVKREGIAI